MRLSTVLSAVTSFTLALGMPLAVIPSVAQAASPPLSKTDVTRGQYVEQLLQAVGDQPASNAQQSFSDVPSSSPYFGWVEAAYKAGITTGTVAPVNGRMGVFGLNADLTRAEAAAFDLRAYDSGVATYAQEKSTWYARGMFWNPSNPAYDGTVSFDDYLDIPTALQGDVYVASSIGLLHGFPDGTFGPQQNLTSAQTADLISQLTAVEATEGPYHWRWFLSEGGLSGETAFGNILDLFAGAVRGLPYGQVSSPRPCGRHEG